MKVVSGLIFRDGLLLLQQRSIHRDYSLLWETPGGKVEPGETQREALCRELEEELGLVISPRKTRRLSTETLLPPEVHIAVEITYYKVTVPRKWQPKLLDAVGVGWFSREAYLTLPLIPGNIRILPALSCDWDFYSGK